MRAAIYQELKQLYPVYYVGNVQKTTELPFVILSFGTPIRTRLGNWQTFYVSCYAPLGNFALLDTMCERIITALDKRHVKRISEESVFLIEFTNCTGDDVESRLNAITRQLNFRVPIFGGNYM